MKNDSIVFPSILIVAVLLILAFSIHIPAQSFEPDAQIKKEMLAYLAKNEDVPGLACPRVAEEGNLLFVNTVQKSEVKNFDISVAEPSSKMMALEHQAFEILNRRRAENSLEPLIWSDEIAKVARLHSENMAQLKFFSHTGADGTMVNNRADLLGLSDWQSIGENIAYNRGFKKPVESACEQWMQSPSHRHNILNKKWNEAGIGLAIAADGTYYFTEVFMLR